MNLLGSLVHIGHSHPKTSVMLLQPNCPPHAFVPGEATFLRWAGSYRHGGHGLDGVIQCCQWFVIQDTGWNRIRSSAVNSPDDVQAPPHSYFCVSASCRPLPLLGDPRDSLASWLGL